MPPIAILAEAANRLLSREASASASANPLQVVCAWPVSGQYGPGSRVLYYVLVATCVLARKEEWLRNACVAAALLFPAIAALHGIVLAAMPIKGAVDMDIYGAFQLCAIGILAAPVTVKRSQTYFFDPARNLIFLWTGLVLAGLLSLTIAFYRVGTVNCTEDELGNSISSNPSLFAYNTTCGIRCSTTTGPHSPMRGGANNNIYVIPAPSILTFANGTLLSAAGCIPAVLSMVSMWNKILEINWKSRYGDRHQSQRNDNTPIDGTNGATPQFMQGVEKTISKFLSAVESYVFGVVVLAILIFGERNFWSKPVRFQTEPMASVGQWAPIIGTGFAALGSLYVYLATPEAQRTPAPRLEPTPPNNFSTPENEPKIDIDIIPPEAAHIEGRSSNNNQRNIPDSRHSSLDSHSHNNLNGPNRRPTIDLQPAESYDSALQLSPSTTFKHQRTTSSSDVGARRTIANFLTKTTEYLTNAAEDTYDDSDFKEGNANQFPTVPGEELRNQDLRKVQQSWNTEAEAAARIARSRPPSTYGGSTADLHDGPSSPTPTTPTATAAVSPTSRIPSRSPSPNPQTRRATMPDGNGHGHPSSPSTPTTYNTPQQQQHSQPTTPTSPLYRSTSLPSGPATRGRSATHQSTNSLEVPTISYHGSSGGSGGSGAGGAGTAGSYTPYSLTRPALSRVPSAMTVGDGGGGGDGDCAVEDTVADEEKSGR